MQHVAENTYVHGDYVITPHFTQPGTWTARDDKNWGGIVAHGPTPEDAVKAFEARIPDLTQLMKDYPQESDQDVD